MRLTSKMATIKLANSDNCKIFFPFNEGAGTTATDSITGGVFTDETALHTVPHTSALLTLDFSGVTEGWLNIPADSIYAVAVGAQVRSLHSFVKFMLGATSNTPKIEVSATFNIQDNDDNTLVTSPFTTATDGQDSFALLVVDQVNGTAYVHEAINGASASLAETITSGVPSAGFIIPPAGALSNAFEVPMYGAGVWTLDNVPSETDRNAALNFMQDNWSNGVKVLPPQFA